MGISKMKYLNVYGPEKSLQSTLGAIAHCGCFEPEGGEAIHSPIRAGTNEYEPLLTKAKGLLKDLEKSSLAADYVGAVDAYALDEVADFLEKFAAEVAQRSRRKTEIESHLELQEKTEEILSHMTDLDLSIEDLFTVKTLKVRVGRLPKNSYARLMYYAEKGFNFTSYFNYTVYDFDGEYYWGLYFAPSDNAKDIDDIFNALYFERIWVPDFVHGKPEEALADSRKKEAQLRSELSLVVTSSGVASETELTQIQNMTAWLNTMNQLYDMKKYVLVFNHTFYISGFVPSESFAAFEKIIGTVTSVHIKETKNKQEVPVSPPVKLKNNRFARPYQMFTEMYGLPNYNGIDPTGLVAVLYSVLYGVMFADVGQGLVLGLVGYFLMYKRKNMAIGLILTRAAVFSCIFGFLFGSVFGYENLMDPIWRAMGLHEKPFEVLGASSINLILVVSVCIGVAVVMMTIIINIVSKLRRGEVGKALTGSNGVAGLVFYGAAVGMVLDMAVLKTGFASGTPYLLLLIVLPLVVMYMQEPLSELIAGKGFRIEDPGDFFVSGFFELFVSILEYLSNTVSFLRVGGFVLAHAGMMSVVTTLAAMAGNGAVVVMIFGNIFVICLEGLIVGIQALRLNFYEVFSRFYEADGKPFAPLCIVSDTTEL